ncbi:hypothetical protein DACRYDRAFT_23318 [Dacryopinax primogenitus]|uniref:Uncharacterized protein n=1 Tax=Dacryopinax primogenitus (strain DJM 731) TaxID=1858805 RepID=M5FXC4_DACPD|nr:uncharacterized protein DACRYDRAFT_23318 [Dacryopinax primogenitus]EJU00425.1 hypothetical protein DACRYDRAFT_23318 [Dacryopinax primogenitus]
MTIKIGLAFYHRGLNDHGVATSFRWSIVAQDSRAPDTYPFQENQVDDSSGRWETNHLSEITLSASVAYAGCILVSSSLDFEVPEFDELIQQYGLHMDPHILPPGYEFSCAWWAIGVLIYLHENDFINLPSHEEPLELYSRFLARAHFLLIQRLHAIRHGVTVQDNAPVVQL